MAHLVTTTTFRPRPYPGDLIGQPGQGHPRRGPTQSAQPAALRRLSPLAFPHEGRAFGGRKGTCLTSIRTSVGDASYVRCVSESISIAFGGDELGHHRFGSFACPGRGGSRHGSPATDVREVFARRRCRPRPVPLPMGSRTGPAGPEHFLLASPARKSEPADRGTVPQNSGPQFTDVPHVTHLPQSPRSPPTKALLEIQGR